jgi:hypothetical protein
LGFQERGSRGAFPVLDLYAELVQIIDTLSKQKLPYALVGGIAVSLYTRPRATEDIDLLVREEDWGAIRSAMERLGYTVEANPMLLAQGRLLIRRLTKLSGEDFLVLDFLIPQTDEIVSVLENRKRLSWQGRDLWIAAVQDLKRLKALRGSLQDKADIEALEGGEG